MTNLSLQVKLESPAPAPLPAGSGSAVLLYGTCFHPHRAVRELEIVVEGQGRYRPAAWAMPRPELTAAEGPFSRRSGFWATVPVERRADPGTAEISVAARLEGGVQELARLTAVEWVEEPAGPVSPPTLPDGTIAVCMATYEPDLDLFRTQVDSLRAQSDTRWACFISDDRSSDERFEAMRELLADDPRVELSRADHRLGFYRNFERAMRMAPPEAELIALCDQDDRWHPHKLATLRRALGDAVLAYSDQRLVDKRGVILRETMWRGRANNHTDLVALLTANTITGAATLFRREIASLALPFPDLPGIQFHDHWVACVALAAGEIAYVDMPLYDYVQHSGAVFGEVAGSRPTARARTGPRRLLLRWRGAYFLGYLQRELMAKVLLVRCATLLAPGKRRALERFVQAQRSVTALVWLTLRPLRALRGRTDTLGSELDLVGGILWKLAVVLVARIPGRRAPDVSFPEPLAFEQKRLRRWRSRA
jgi:glycosyltransferase involved in cell wall biosynthesis